jgi:rod shape-determining protein MreD
VRLFLLWVLVLALGLLGQTTLFPNLFAPPWRPDITRALVLWLALTGTPRGGPALAFASGLALDLCSGAPLGFGAALRLLVYALARPFRGVFFADHPILLVPFAALGACADALAAGLLGRWVFLGPVPGAVLIGIAWRQALLDALWVPAVFLCLELLAGRQARPQVTV